MKGLSLEVKVGLLILAAAILLGSFLFLLGGVSFKDDYPIYVEFNNPGSVQTGAAVRIGGVRVGSVEEVEYLGRRLDPATGRRPLVRMQLSLHRDVQDTIHFENIRVYVTSQGVIGEQFIAIDPGDPESRAVEEGETLVGHDPPRLDQALDLGFELLEVIVDGINENRDDLGTLLDDVVALVHALRLVMVDNRGNIDEIIANVLTLSEEGVTTLRSARENFIEGERPQRILRNIDRTVTVVNRETPGLLREIRETASGANEVLETIGPEQRTQIQNTLASAERIATSAETTVTEANEVVRHMREGRGTVGALLMDEEIYDDLQELIRDLKHNPWKFFWRE